MFETDNEILRVCGDTDDIYFTLDGVDERLVNKVYFSSHAANIRQQLTRTNNGYLLPGSVLSAVSPGYYTYDLTVLFIDEALLTVIHNAPLSIVEKTNPIA